MKRFMLLAVLGVVGLVLADVVPAEAHTCNSVCNQVRRACRRIAKADRQVARADCDATRDTCRADCEANADTCQTDCEASCMAACAGDLVCEAGCPDACADSCASCIPDCNDARSECFGLAEDARQAANDACDTARESCNLPPEQGGCQDPIDNTCVKGCMSDRKGCDRNAKLAEKQCKQTCNGGEGQRACMRDCRKAKNAALSFCSDLEVGCLAGCAGITLSSTD